MTLEEAKKYITNRMDQIKSCFRPGVNVTVLVRVPGLPDCDFMLTDDEIPELMKMLKRRALEQWPPESALWMRNP
jgi:hypothetical protein